MGLLKKNEQKRQKVSEISSVSEIKCFRYLSVLRNSLNFFNNSGTTEWRTKCKAVLQKVVRYWFNFTDSKIYFNIWWDFPFQDINWAWNPSSFLNIRILKVRWRPCCNSNLSLTENPPSIGYSAGFWGIFPHSLVCTIVSPIHTIHS